MSDPSDSPELNGQREADLAARLESRQQLESLWSESSAEQQADPCTFNQALEPAFWHSDSQAVTDYYRSVSAEDLQLVQPSLMSDVLWEGKGYPTAGPSDYRIGRIAFPAIEISDIPFSPKKIEERVSMRTVAANRRDNPVFNEFVAGEDNDKVARSVAHALEGYKRKMEALLPAWDAEEEWLAPLAYLSRPFNRNRTVGSDELQGIEGDYVSVGDMQRYMLGLITVSFASLLDAMRIQLRWSNETHRNAAMAFGKRMFDDPKKAEFTATTISLHRAWLNKKRARVTERLTEIDRITGATASQEAS